MAIEIFRFFSEPESVHFKNLCSSWSYESETDVRNSLKKENNFLYYAKKKDLEEWIGAIYFSFFADQGDIWYIYVNPLFRGQGIGQMIFQYLFKHHPSVSFFLEVRKSNKEAIALYEKVGMQKIAIRKSYYLDGEDALIYKKQ